MVGVVQFGEGNFLRAFADSYFNALNEEGAGEYAVYIVKPAPFGTLDAFKKQNNFYNVVLRGYENGKEVEKVRPISCIKEAVDPFLEPDRFFALARKEDVKLVVSNTTEAGICYNENDRFNDKLKDITYPAKLVKFLYERFCARLDGVYILPVELIDDNAVRLKECVDKYVDLWSLPDEFRAWNETQNYYCSTLVDRIVSGHPKDEETKKRLFTLTKSEDALLTVGEPFGLWAIEKKGEISRYIKEGTHDIDVVLTDDIAYYKKRKVRVLNGSHTNLVPFGLLHGKSTVYECMCDETIKAFVENTMQEEICPFVSDDLATTVQFAKSVTSRFLNPFLNHRLDSILLNSLSKWKARVLPTFSDYYTQRGKIPARLTLGFSYLTALYQRAKRIDGKYLAGTIELKDEPAYLERFASGYSVKEFMQDATLWGEDLTAYEGFLTTVEDTVFQINQGGQLP